MRTVKDHERMGIYCPWTGKRGGCVDCMAMIEVSEKTFMCGRLYPQEPEYFKEETK
jgi:hypothetical protein